MIWILSVSIFCRYSCHLVVSLSILENLSYLCHIKNNNNNNNNELRIFQISSSFLSSLSLSFSKHVLPSYSFDTAKHCLSYLKTTTISETHLNFLKSTFSLMFLWQQKMLLLFNVRKRFSEC